MNRLIFVRSAIILVTTFIFTHTLSAQVNNEIFSGENPILVPVWNRIADVSPALRAVETIECSPNGQFVVSGGKFGYKVMYWRVADGTLLWENAHESEVECVAFSPDGKRIASGGEDFYVRVWNAETGEELYKWEHDSGLDGITWSHDGKWIATGSEAGDAYIWNADSYGMEAKIKTGSTINSLQFSRDDTKLLVGGNIQTPDSTTGKNIYTGFASLIDVKKKAVIQEYEHRAASIKSVRFSPDEKQFAAGGFDSTACIYDTQSGEILHTFKEARKVEAVAFSPDGQYLAVGGHELAIKFYRTSDFQLAYAQPSPRVEYLDFSDDGRILVAAHEDSGLISCYLLLSNTQASGNYHELSNKQLNNRDLKEN